MDLIIFASCAEAYAIHATDAIPIPIKREKLRRIGSLKQEIKIIGPPVVPCNEIEFDSGIRYTNERETNIRRAELCKDDIDLDLLQSWPMDPDPDIFFETLIGMIKNDLISYQAFAFKKEREQLHELKNNIGRLKSTDNYENFDEIFRLEHRLDGIIDKMMKSEIEKNSLYDILNTEKITPHFLKMMKVGGGSESLSQIKDDTGTEFNSVNERKSFIMDFYRDLYSEPANLTPLNDNSIAEFLGPEICMTSVVQNAKLTDPEKNLLLTDFSLREMDESVKEAKAATAGGPDGIGNACIKKIWPYIRKPLTSFANECIRKGSLTDNFRTASIKLIPKKGDLSKLKNWRPISLLNCLYKVISRAINTRLKKVSNRVLSRAQKGFTSEKYIQECIINIVNNVQRSEQLNNFFTSYRPGKSL
jgi:hypothetical protein